MGAKPIPVSKRQAEVDRRLRDCFKENDISAVASRLGYADPSPLSRQLNWQEQNENAVFKALEFIEACQGERDELAQSVLGVFNYFLEQITGRSVDTADDDTALDKANLSLSELVSARLNNLPYSERMDAVRELKAQAVKLERGYMFRDMEEGGMDERRQTYSRSDVIS